MEYLNAKQVHSDALRRYLNTLISIQMRLRKFWATEAEGIQMPKNGRHSDALKPNSNAQESIRIL